MLIFDIETNGLKDYTKIHTMTIYDYFKKEYMTYDKDQVSMGIRRLQEADCILGHNILGFDLPAIERLYPWFRRPDRCLDTLVLARVAYADVYDIDVKLGEEKIPKKLWGSHSLEAYGYRLGVFKGDFGKETDWTEWSEEMSSYCHQDVTVTVALYQKLISKDVPDECLELEHKVAEIIHRQTQHGFLFDNDKAQVLYAKLLQRKEELTGELQKVFPPWQVRMPDFIPKKDNQARGYIAGVPVKKFKTVIFNPGSRDHIAYQLQNKFGWKPTEFTESSKPKIDEDVLLELPYPEAKPLIEYFIINKRLGQLGDGDKAWLKLVDKDGRIHGEVITNGAVTGRMTHHNPNIAQVPAVKVPYGYECRELFTVPKGYKLVGCDASGLELRCLAHFMGDDAYTHEILNGDIHTKNQHAAGLATRAEAKRFIYAYLYGGGDALIGSLIGKGPKEGKKIKKRFLEQTPALKSLRERVDKAAKRGYLKGLDGRHLKIRSPHAALNVLLQSAGALVMKKALTILDYNLKQQGFTNKDYNFVANIHDEFQIEVKEEYAEYIGGQAVLAIRAAGDYFKFRCPLDGEWSMGNNWAETH